MEQNEKIIPKKWLKKAENDYVSKKRENEINALETRLSKNSLNIFYEYYCEILETTTHTLEQAQKCAYIEFFGDRDAREYIRNAKYSGIDYVIKTLPKGALRFDNFQKEFNNTVDDFLHKIFGAQNGLNIFKDEEYTEKNPSYEISEEDMYFILYLFATSRTEDAENFLCGHYAYVSEEYYDMLRCGANMIIEQRNTDISKEYIDFQFDIVFGIKARKMEEAIMDSLQIVQEIISFKFTKESCDKADECISMIENFNKELIKMRNELLSTL